MLKFLAIENFALIDRLEIEFEAGLNLVTGETGSGKSILVDAVGLLAGGRASQEMVRQGFSKARLEGIFVLEDKHPARRMLKKAGIDLDQDQLIVRREIALSGANKVFVNQSLTTASFLSELGSYLVDIHGQHDQQQLLQPSNHLEFLDAFGSNGQLLDQVQAAYGELSRVQAEVESLKRGEQQRLQRLDMLRFQMEDIEKLELQPGISQQLEEEGRLLASAEKRLAGALESYQLLYEQEGAVVEQLGLIGRSLQELSQLDAQLEGSAKRLEEVRYQLEEIAYQLRDYQDGVEFNPSRLDAVQERLAGIQKASRKYGRDADALLEYYQTLQSRIDELEQGETRLEELQASQVALQESYLGLAQSLSASRRQEAAKLGRAVEGELASLAMRNSVVHVDLQSDPESGTGKGIDQVEFLISANPGETPRPLARIASGGELSRMILALKSILTLEKYSKTLVFDEVDAGIGGRVASSVGERLARLSARQQVFCVTHLPQVACRASRHLQVHKVSHQDRTTVRIEVLDKGRRVEELARMLAGESVTDAATRHARELLRQAKRKSKQPAAT